MQTQLHDNLILTQKGAYEILRIDREPALGALNFEIMAALEAYFDTVHSRCNDRNDSVRVVIITGTGKGFVAGADIKGYHQVDQVTFDSFQRLSRQTFDKLQNLPQMTICAVNGYALGGGFELALACDFILASETAKLGLPEVKLGLLPGGGGTQRLPRLVGHMRAKQLIATGRVITADEAKQYGAVLETYPPQDLMPKAEEFAQSLVDQAPIAMLEAKRVVDDGLDMALSAGLTFEQRVLGSLFATEDGKEGIRAFIEKRQAVFQGN